MPDAFDVTGSGAGFEHRKENIVAFSVYFNERVGVRTTCAAPSCAPHGR
jgi:hypothetical protein